jgi:hypothetical protein
VQRSVAKVPVDHRDPGVRIDRLEERVQSLESQFLQFRVVHDEFSAVRREMRGGYEALAREMRELNAQTLTEMRVLHEDVIERIKLLGRLPTKLASSVTVRALGDV